MADPVNCWGTPRDLVEDARYVLGGIDLDPASTPEDNLVVGAHVFYTEEQDGLAQGWGYQSIFVNPPGPHSLVKRFWAKAYEAANAGSDVFWVGFNLGQLRYLAPSPLDCPSACILRSRIHFRDPEGKGRESGRYDNYLALWSWDEMVHTRFVERFEGRSSWLRCPF